MGQQEINKLILRFFVAMDKFYESGLSEHWLSEMKSLRQKIESCIKRIESEKADSKQLKIFK